MMIKVFDPPYAKKLMKERLAKSGVPVAFVGGKVDAFIDDLAKDGIAFLQAGSDSPVTREAIQNGKALEWNGK
jgi:hypothetical protein